MKLTFKKPDYEYMINSIMEHQQDGTTAYWNDALFYYYKNLNKDYAYSLSTVERKQYFNKELKKVYEDNFQLMNNKILDYQAHWEQHQSEIEAALSEAFRIDCSQILNDIVCNITLNPVCPRYLKEHCFDMFYLNSERGALGISIHELIHYIWFMGWHELFQDTYEEYETPSLKWILSELVVEAIMDDPRLSSLNPYYPRENGGCIYSYFFTMVLDGKAVTDAIREMYQNMNIREFMQESYKYCQKHEKAIRRHIETYCNDTTLSHLYGNIMSVGELERAMLTI